MCLHGNMTHLIYNYYLYKKFIQIKEQSYYEKLIFYLCFEVLDFIEKKNL